MLDSAIVDALWLSLKLAGISTLILVIIGIPLAWWLSQSRGLLGALVKALVTLPLILPPTVLGYYLLVAFSIDSPVGGAWQRLFDASLAFSFSGLVIASLIYSLPFAIQPMMASFASINRELLLTAQSLGANIYQKMRYVILPLSRQGVGAGAILAFAHTIGEFGVVLLIGGNIPGETQVLSIALYDLVENLQWQRANLLAGSMLAFSLLILVLLNLIQTKRPR